VNSKAGLHMTSIQRISAGEIIPVSLAHGSFAQEPMLPSLRHGGTRLVPGIAPQARMVKKGTRTPPITPAPPMVPHQIRTQVFRVRNQ